jgi:hypothetical protein
MEVLVFTGAPLPSGCLFLTQIVASQTGHGFDKFIAYCIQKLGALSFPGDREFVAVRD